MACSPDAARTASLQVPDGRLAHTVSNEPPADHRPLRLVLITSGLNGVCRAFASLPGGPCGIVRILGDETEPRATSALRSLRRVLLRQPYATAGEYAAFFDMEYAEIHKRDGNGLRAALKRMNADLAIVFRTPVLDVSALSDLSVGAINVHGSWLPDYRGGHPLFWQVHDQTDSLGVSVHFVTAAVDAGAVLEQSRVVRPAGAHRDVLEALTAIEQGVPLLRSIIVRLEAGDRAAIDQPKASPTRYASNLSMSKLSRELELSALSLDALWDIASYFGCWPTEFGDYRGWRRWLRWVPIARLDEPAARTRCANGQLQLVGTTIWLLHRDGRIRLRPRVDALQLLRAVARSGRQS